jgi:Zn-dependent protease
MLNVGESMAQGSLKIGKLLGIDIYVHWTLLLLLLFALVISTSDLLLFIVVLLLFICVLVHEMAHSVVAIKNGIKVREIVLNIIGGASMIDTTNINPEVEFRISIVGPLTNIFLGSIFGVIVLFTGVSQLTFVLQFLFEINILLGVFNILPAFPMDGGRVLRSWLKESKSDYDATMATVKVSYWITGIIVAAALIYVITINASFFYKEIDFFIFLIIAVFLFGGTQAEMQSATMKMETSGLKVGKLLSKSFVVVDSSASIEHLYSIALEKKEHIILTRLNGTLMALDLFRGRSGRVSSIAELAVPVAVMKSSTNVFDALTMISALNSGIGAVTSNGKVVGIITTAKIQAFIYLHMLKSKNRKEYKR